MSLDSTPENKQADSTKPEHVGYIVASDIYNKNKFEDFAAEGQPIPPPTPQILPTAPNSLPIPPTRTISNAAATKTTKFGQIDNSDGMPDQANEWMLSAKAYFDVNDTIYDSDRKKVFEALSHMKEGAALAWEETKLTEYIGSAKYPKWTDFETDFNGTFIIADVKGAASAALMTMKMETGGKAVKFNSCFMVEARKSGLNDGGLIMVYKRWMSTVSGLDANWTNSNSISEGKWGKKGEKKKEEKGGRSQLSSVKCLTKNKEDLLKRDGQCFICKEQGYISQFCPEKKKGKQPDQRIRMAEVAEKDETETVVEDGKGISHILKMWRELNEADQASAIDGLEKEGF
ncbi:hypothetical protein SERLA73DRAFT_152238 [Serpula lacrymans var. lacrymans S7.3]|uniref:CCHC-type domain-containing protein n=2 Tax=Serpula lacrymans var. lacrymans TaxID=341189 RepID=F8PVE0_SERL3|nr:uncharacterized protein SERLADRAFT_437437 [Serpula lacrymans var. lacrymans S7.9]EGO00150.1 hypothetical protein SERLA73DRAFT_152238 [Serpula lacrymans var. lacrymans S7.3]EGO25712.1 hypothetical protein SERLADRAFT_437437 [Serpula lacrymans var. lacrymans S7.9]